MSSLEKIRDFIRDNPHRQVPEELKPAADELRKRAEYVRRIGHEVELSPYMRSLLNLK